MKTDLSCRELIELVTDYLEGALDESDRRRFEAHLASCKGCQTYLDQMRETLALLGGIQDSVVPAETLEALFEAFRTWKAEA